MSAAVASEDLRLPVAEELVSSFQVNFFVVGQFSRVGVEVQVFDRGRVVLGKSSAKILSALP
jgi:hypothetical protein